MNGGLNPQNTLYAVKLGLILVFTEKREIIEKSSKLLMPKGRMI